VETSFPFATHHNWQCCFTVGFLSIWKEEESNGTEGSLGRCKRLEFKVNAAIGVWYRKRRLEYGRLQSKGAACSSKVVKRIEMIEEEKGGRVWNFR